MNKMSDMVRQQLANSMTIDEMMVNIEIDYYRLLNLLNSQNRFILQING